MFPSYKYIEIRYVRPYSYPDTQRLTYGMGHGGGPTIF